MFFPGSRYANMTQYQVKLRNGATVTVTTLPLPTQSPLLGSFPRQNSQRLDQIAYHFLSDATATYDYPDRGFGSMPNADVHRATLVVLAASTAHVMSVDGMKSVTLRTATAKAAE